MSIKNKKKIFKIISVSTSIIISFFIVELILTFSNFNYYRGIEYDRAISKIDGFDKRRRYDYYQEKILTDPKTVVTIAPYWHLNKKKKILPLSGISNQNTIYCNELGFFSEYISDRYGLNNPDNVWNKNPNIIILGDSYAHGACLNEPDTIVGNMRRHDLDIGNISYGGNGPLLELATLKEILNVSNPETVIWFFAEANDLSQLEFTKKDPILKKYLNLDNFNQKIFLKQNQTDKFLYSILEDQLILEEKQKNQYKKKIKKRKNLKKKNLKNFLTLTRVRGLMIKIVWKPRNKYMRYDLKLFSNISKKIKSITDQNNIELIFVYLPQFARYSYLQNNKETFKNYKDVIKIIENLNIKIVDIKILFDKYNDPKIFFPLNIGGHYNKKGAEVVAKEILKNIIK